MKKIILSLIIVTIMFTANAQKKLNRELSFYGGGNLALAMGDFTKSHSLGLGLFLKAGYPITMQFDIIGDVGFTNFLGKTVNGQKFSGSSVFHLLAGGSFIAKGGFHIDAMGGFNSFPSVGVGNGFGFRVGAGYKLYDDDIDISAYYHGFSKDGVSLPFIGVGFAYSFIGK